MGESALRPTRTKASKYGFCPKCGQPGVQRGAGGDRCADGHTYASALSIGPVFAKALRKREGKELVECPKDAETGFMAAKGRPQAKPASDLVDQIQRLERLEAGKSALLHDVLATLRLNRQSGTLTLKDPMADGVLQGFLNTWAQQLLELEMEDTRGK